MPAWSLGSPAEPALWGPSRAGGLQGEGAEPAGVPTFLLSLWLLGISLPPPHSGGRWELSGSRARNLGFRGYVEGSFDPSASGGIPGLLACCLCPLL